MSQVEIFFRPWKQNPKWPLKPLWLQNSSRISKIISCNWLFSLSWKWSQEHISWQKQDQFCPQRLKLNLKFSSQIIFHTWPINLNKVQDVATHPKWKTLTTKNETAKCLCAYTDTHVCIYTCVYVCIFKKWLTGSNLIFKITFPKE